MTWLLGTGLVLAGVLLGYFLAAIMAASGKASEYERGYHDGQKNKRDRG